ncbi:hypothetical protein TTHERM_00492910 (macronuclear) [Tetrahymena thermophila SB210]|uniref:Uncharacterized protein n=1 Tax=Tetrahymena thermophila (strain SB210) TaxID=312017 RepID=I7MHF8_TETTS|nr:hypothetical protein TTHERM_00492910 [Tetrahymena thermophila SB210]EAS02938.1 hypothetical protein TTHERM_00492910 [Tetrahymena thermophila SB210]|eukprot:XP_001023183.1 hypothetical protein TTHERM_00492910 [Tetrahymena thermophila SB210]
MNNMFQTTELVMESNDFSSDLNIAISLTNHKLDEKLFPRFVVITSLLLKSFKSFQVTKNKRMLDLFIQLLEGCQNQPFDEKSRSLFQRFKEQLKNLREEQINYRYITEKLQSELFTFTLTLVANIIYHNHEAQQNFLYGPTLISCFKEFNLDIYFNPSEVQPNYTPIVIQQLDYNKYGIMF